MMEFRCFKIQENPVVRHHTAQFHSSPTNHHHFIIIIITIQGTMPSATNILLYDDSLQSESLGDVCLIAVLSSVMMLLRLIEAYLTKNKNKNKKGIQHIDVYFGDNALSNLCTENMVVYLLEHTA